MESNSSSNIESDQNLKQNQGGDEKKSHVNDIDVVYFECKNCQKSFTIRRDQENVDPNSESDICKNCKAKQLFQNALPSGTTVSESIIRSPLSASAVHSAEKFDASDLSPLTTTNSSDNIIVGGSGSGSSRAEQLNLGPSPFEVGESHLCALSAKPPKNSSSNFGVMNLYESKDVLDSDLESLIKEANKKRVERFYAGVDVIYKPADKMVCSCVPLLCPAKVTYYLADEKDMQVEVIVGILLDSHGTPYPVIGVFDSYKQLKNLAKGRTAIHTYFTRFQPTAIVHDFESEHMRLISLELYKFLNIKSPIEEMKGTHT